MILSLIFEKKCKIGKDVSGIIIHDDNDKDAEGASVSVAVLPTDEQIKSPLSEKEEMNYNLDLAMSEVL
jgi:hypothetical protein